MTFVPTPKAGWYLKSFEIPTTLNFVWIDKGLNFVFWGDFRIRP